MSGGVERVGSVGDNGTIGTIHQGPHDKDGRQPLGVLGKNCVPSDLEHWISGLIGWRRLAYS